MNTCLKQVLVLSLVILLAWISSTAADQGDTPSLLRGMPSLPRLLERNPLVIIGTIKHIGKHQDPDLNNTYDTVTIQIDKILKHEHVLNPMVDQEIVRGGNIRIMFRVSLKGKYDVETKGIWIIRYYNNTFWLDDHEVYRSLDKEKEIVEILLNQKNKDK